MATKKMVKNPILKHDEYQAIRDGNIIVLKRIVSDENYGINNTRWSGWNLLHRAAELGKTDVCKLLLVHGALINARTVWGWHTPLHLALSNGFLETATFLMDAGADVNAKNKYKMNAVAYAQHRGQNTVVKDFQAVYLRKEMMKIIKL